MADEAIAIIGMSCRFAPDLDTPEAFWEFLAAGRQAVVEPPSERWEAAYSGDPRTAALMRSSSRPGAFLGDVAGFDAAFFGISPREAVCLDPQQRIVLELAWECLESAGLSPHALRGRDVGVFMSGNSHDYGDRLINDLQQLEGWAVNGLPLFGLANRISYALDFRGPSMTVDTACAGSLTAVHLACQHLWRGEAEVALAGGVQVIAAPGPNVALDAAGATSPDGRSKTFDAAADGYGRGEGAGVVVLKRLGDAQRAGDRVLALVRGGGVFHDGTGDGMMAPHGPAQEHMLQQIYARSEITPDSVGYIETHGTGTPLGDPVEVAALARVFGTGRPARKPCLIGSVKPNIGHLEAGAGIAALIKTVLALRKRCLPPSLYRNLTPAIDWDDSGLKVVSARTPWPAQKAPLRAGVSAFGVGGTIAHLIIEEAPGSPTAEPAVAPLTPAGGRAGGRLGVFPLSAMSPAGLAASARNLADWLDTHPGADLADVGHTLAHRRAHLVERAVFVAEDHARLTAALRALSDGTKGSYVTGRSDLRADGTHPVWVFSGHGAQWTGMGQQLLDEDPAFSAMIDKLGPVYAQEIGFTAREAIEEGDWSTVARVQAITFAMQVALAETWRARGVTPAAVIGHSIGETAAAVVAGALPLEQAARFACRRALIAQRAAGQGGMAMVNLPFVEAHKHLAGYPGLAAAIDAAPDWTVVSGDHPALMRVGAQWIKEGIAVRPVDSDAAFHSPQMDALVPDVIHAARELTPQPTTLPLYSSVTDDPRAQTDRDGAYWGTMLRSPVRFRQAVEAAAEDGHRHFLEVSTQPIVAGTIGAILDQQGIENGTVAHTLRTRKPEVRTLLLNLAALHCTGTVVDWRQLQPAGSLLDLPTTAWQHQPYWLAPSASSSQPAGGHRLDSATLLGAPVSVSGPAALHLWQTEVDFTSRPYPGEHTIHGTEIVPAAVLLATFFAAAHHTSPTGNALREVDLRAPLVLSGPRSVQVIRDADRLHLSSRTPNDPEQPWMANATAVIDRDTPRPRPDPSRIEDLRARCTIPRDWAEIEQRFLAMGLGGYGFTWKATGLHTGAGEFLAHLHAPATGDEPLPRWATLLDGAFTLAQVLAPDDGQMRVLASLQDVCLHAEPVPRVLVHGTTEPDDTIRLRLLAEDGTLLADLAGLRMTPLSGSPQTRVSAAELVHRLTWQTYTPSPDGGRPADVVLVGDDPALIKPLHQQFTRAGIPCQVVDSPQAALATAADTMILVPSRAADRPPADWAEHQSWALLQAARSIAASDRRPLPRLWCVARGVRGDTPDCDLALSPLLGIARIIAGEHPEVWGGLIDVDVDLRVPHEAERLRTLITGAPGEDIIALTDDGEFVQRLMRCEDQPVRPELRCRPESTYLITGGLGPLALHTAHWLVTRGARRLVLVGRRSLPERSAWTHVTDPALTQAITAIGALEAQGITVRYICLDITDLPRARTLLEAVALELPPVRGIVHAAGVVEGALLAKVERAALRRVLEPKTRGTLVLDELYPPGSVDFFALFSSCGQLARISGQAAYAAANSFLDALAQQRRRAGCEGTISLAWTTWLGDHQSTGHDVGLFEGAQQGFGGVTPQEAFEAWKYAARRDDALAVITRAEPLPPGVAGLPVRTHLTFETPHPDETGALGDSSATAPPWRDAPEPERLAMITTDLQEQVGAELKMPPSQVEVHRPLPDMGLDSIHTVKLRARLSRRYAIEIPPTLLWERPTVSGIAAFVNENAR
ncbi:beta-ketoacyl synthase N-terminal-like domain-containing protein [Streptomyces sp. NPDC051546]|uniref:type I polyketide synthase n=1 Tax=Streptomyces sp. NPDC051546 TaxID=3365655 RepID=UPI00378A242C